MRTGKMPELPGRMRAELQGSSVFGSWQLAGSIKPPIQVRWSLYIRNGPRRVGQGRYAGPVRQGQAEIGTGENLKDHPLLAQQCKLELAVAPKGIHQKGLLRRRQAKIIQV